MARDAEDQFTTHELAAKSGHKSLSELERYTRAARKKKLADSGAAKSRAARAVETAEKARANPPRIVRAEKA
jgi:hypothetical protein